MRQFINNHTRRATGAGRQTKLDLSGKKHPRWQLYQAYSHLYYKKKLRHLINDEYTVYLATLPTGIEPDKLFVFRNRRLRELYECESDDVKAEVEALRQKSPSLKEERAVEDMMDEGMSETAVHDALRKS